MNRSDYWKQHGHPRLDLMEQSISGEPVTTKEQRRLRDAILAWIKRLVKK